MDVWVTQVGLGAVPQPDGRGCRGTGESIGPDSGILARRRAFVTFWVRKPKGASGSDIPEYGGCPHLADSPGRTSRAWPSSTGRVTALASRITRLGRETRCSYRRV